MSTYVISFRIADRIAGGKTYDERRQALIEATRKHDGGFWDATTSFFLTESDLDTISFGNELCAGLDATHDMLVVFDPSDMSMVYFGAVPNPDILGSFFEGPKKLP